jgi:hypothetical protein
MGEPVAEHEDLMEYLLFEIRLNNQFFLVYVSNILNRGNKNVEKAVLGVGTNLYFCTY